MSTTKVPTMDAGSYVCIMHPSVAYHLRKDEDWRKPHEYVDTDGIYNGEIGKLYGFRVIENPLATVIKANANDPAVYQTFFLGKDAFGVIDAEGGNKQMIVKTKEEVGGPLEQFGTVGVKFEFAAKILYPERILVVESGSSKFGAVDVAN
jgi:N4-gp56 family major capsid protein